MAIQQLDHDLHRAKRTESELRDVLALLDKHGLLTGDTVTYIKRKMADASRQITNHCYKTNTDYREHMEDDIYEFRYEAHGGEFKLKCWYNGKEDTMYGAVFDQPEWLTGIVDVAKVAGHLKTPITPPPEVILWFHTDKNRTLINFIELAP